MKTADSETSEWRKVETHLSISADPYDPVNCHYWWTDGEIIHLCDLQDKHETAHICNCSAFT